MTVIGLLLEIQADPLEVGDGGGGVRGRGGKWKGIMNGEEE